MCNAGHSTRYTVVMGVAGVMVSVNHYYESGPRLGSSEPPTRSSEGQSDTMTPTPRQDTQRDHKSWARPSEFYLFRKWLVRWIQERLFHKLGNYNDYYGHAYIAAQYCGIGSAYPPMDGIWPHGWTNPHVPLISWDARKEDRVFAWNERERSKAKMLGYIDPIVIGSPFIYLTNPEFSPDNRNLFVAPDHGTDLTEGVIEHHRELYVMELKQWLPMFDRVIVCLHAHDYGQPHVVSLFERAGCEVVLGARPHDVESLYRVRSYLGDCGYATSNHIGTVVWYMAYAGCRVFIAGNSPTLLKSLAQSTDMVYVENAEAAAQADKHFDLRGDYPELPRSPQDAKKVIDLGIRELGYECRKSPEELQRFFGWTPERLAMYYPLKVMDQLLNRPLLFRSLRRLIGVKPSRIARSTGGNGR